MDFSAIASAVTAISTARDMAKGLVGLRDEALVREHLAALNEVLLKTQEQLFAHNAAFSKLADEHHKARQELRELQEAMRERGRYTLVHLGSSQFAYRVDLTPETGGTSQPGRMEADHYICQPCFDIGRKVVLQGLSVGGVPCGYTCPICKTQINP